MVRVRVRVRVIASLASLSPLWNRLPLLPGGPFQRVFVFAISLGIFIPFSCFSFLFRVRSCSPSTAPGDIDPRDVHFAGVFQIQVWHDFGSGNGTLSPPETDGSIGFSLSVINQWGRGFHFMPGGFELGDRCFGPQLFRVVDIWTNLLERDAILSSLGVALP